jgi:hypothetical protein
MNEDGLMAKLLGSIIGAAVGGALAYASGVKPAAGLVLGAAAGRLAMAALFSQSHVASVCGHCGHSVADADATFCPSCNRALSGLF